MRAVVFDLDGTLIDSAPDLHAAAVRLLADEGKPPLTQARIGSFIGNGVHKLVERVIDASGLSQDDHPRLTERFLDYYNAAPSAMTTIYPGIVSLLGHLRDQGIALGVCTNKPEAPARAILRDLELEAYFDAVIGGDALPVNKPDPAPLELAFKLLGNGRRLYVGDSEVDAETADRAGVDFALFTEGYRKVPVADLPHMAAFDHFDALPAIIDRFFETQSAT